MKNEPEGFKEFWEGVWRPHARHTDGRGLARDTYAKLVKGGADPQDIIDGARYFIRTLKDPQYIPLSATWLNRRAFEDLAGMERRYQQSRTTPKPQEPEDETNVVQISPDKRREMAARARKLISGVHQMKDAAAQQRAKALKEWRRPIDTDVGADTARARGKQGKYPVGSWHAWALDTVYGPVNSAKEAAE